MTGAYGYAKDGVCALYVDVATAGWIGQKDGVLQCMIEVYKFPLKELELQRLDSTHEAYVSKVRASVAEAERNIGKRRRTEQPTCKRRSSGGSHAVTIHKEDRLCLVATAYLI